MLNGLDHRLKLWTVIIGGGRTILPVLRADFMLMQLAIRLELAKLIRDGQVLFGLFDGRNSRIQCNPHNAFSLLLVI
jgi:hypothetical protein